MDIPIDLSTPKDTALELGRFEDLEYLVEVLNNAWEAFEYRLDKVPHSDRIYVFAEDPIAADEYECGVVEKHDGKAYAFSPAVHDMIMGAYARYVDEFGELDTE